MSSPDRPSAVRRVLSARIRARAIVVVAIVLAVGLYVGWRRANVTPGGPRTEADTSCFVSRIGLPCRE